VDHVLIFCVGTRREAETLERILNLFSIATRTLINERKSTLSSHVLYEEELDSYIQFFPFEVKDLDDEMKYSGFNLKPNDYRKVDSLWLMGKLEKRLHLWSHRWLSRDGRLVIVKYVVEAIPVYWMSLSWIPKGILEATRCICFKFLWSGMHDSYVAPWVRWE